MPLIANPSRTAVAEVAQESLSHWLAEGWIHVESIIEVDDAGETTVSYQIAAEAPQVTESETTSAVLPGLEVITQAPEPTADSTPVGDFNQDETPADAGSTTTEEQ